MFEKVGFGLGSVTWTTFRSAACGKWRALFIVALMVVATPLPAFADGLRILLANDDGYASPGLVAVRKALVEAGHDVVVVAPEGNRSGASSSITAGGELDLVEQEPGVWSVSGTPADAVHVGLDVVLAGAAPDLVVSGANFGQNIGPATLVSGTVGAALSAMQRGVPAIAVSVGIDPREMESEPRFKSTFAAFPGCAALTVELIAALQASRPAGAPLLPPRTVINLNYPALVPDAIKGVVHATVGRAESFTFAWKAGERGKVVADFKREAAEESVENADTTLFAAGYVTITTLDRDVLAPADRRAGIEKRIAPLLAK